MASNLGYAERMGEQLRAEVERQLLEDLQYYGINTTNLVIDWSQTCPEGHTTEYLNGYLENWSGVAVLTQKQDVVADGWIDFIHDGGDNPLFVFWDFLVIVDNGCTKTVKRQPGVPSHIWDKLPQSSKKLYTKWNEYDAARLP